MAGHTCHLGHAPDGSRDSHHTVAAGLGLAGALGRDGQGRGVQAWKAGKAWRELEPAHLGSCTPQLASQSMPEGNRRGPGQQVSLS